ncbi:hypothetical protein TTHERM_000440489 (macronuclear) [Tetrahymena thermophila SB210]|uniref:Uncharacterized protein n=1 Tax=Tetrahymena thermophila (strain SB210) TaxID=312017 RepID=W7XHP4_TETTS|nr:hypothetical protein TTHERM_000440489 [Tetrahymena thermophila SB210]EWS73951.1 hypothetical protein TTHERM_000440489 [Tetrahymena thermophila SB210]|eukprot:XP_012653492.1 hypothetical protein TTHERM_000440489 [Tetrahymena thermophila SB210]
MERIDFSQLFKNNNWDPFKISRSLILEILLQLDSEKKNQNQQNQQKNKDVLLESKVINHAYFFKCEHSFKYFILQL